MPGPQAYIIIKSHPPKASTLQRHPPKLCTDAADDWIFQFQANPRGTNSRLLILTHASNLRRHISKPMGALPIQVPWAQWGLDHAYCLFPVNMMTSSGNNRCESIYGERFAYVTERSRRRDDRLMCHIYVYDFNQTRVRRARHSASSASWPPFQSGKAMPSLDHRFAGTIRFEGVEITGRLPYLMTTVDVDVAAGPYKPTLAMDEEHLIIWTVRPRSTSEKPIPKIF